MYYTIRIKFVMLFLMLFRRPHGASLGAMEPPLSAPARARSPLGSGSAAAAASSSCMHLANPPFPALFRRPFQQIRRFPHFFSSDFNKPAVFLTFRPVLGSKTVATCGFVESGSQKLLRPAGLSKWKVENCCDLRVCQSLTRRRAVAAAFGWDQRQALLSKVLCFRSDEQCTSNRRKSFLAT